MPMQLRSRSVVSEPAPKKSIGKSKRTSTTKTQKTSAAKRGSARALTLKQRAMLKSMPISKAHQQETLDLKTAKIESLGTTLKATPASRPALRAKLQAQIANKGNKRGAYTRGWAGRAPKPGKERAELLATCGPGAFLLPNKQQPGKSKFPVVARVLPGKSRAENCAVDCGGSQSALIRARQHGYSHVADAAVKILEEKCPDSARARAKRGKSAEKRAPAPKQARGIVQAA